MAVIRHSWHDGSQNDCVAHLGVLPLLKDTATCAKIAANITTIRAERVANRTHRTILFFVHEISCLQLLQQAVVMK